MNRPPDPARPSFPDGLQHRKLAQGTEPPPRIEEDRERVIVDVDLTLEPRYRLFPQPPLSLMIVFMWTILQPRVTVGTLLMGALIGWLVPLFTHRFISIPISISNVPKLIRFTIMLLYDILISNLKVARLILSPWRKPRSAWIVLPISSVNPHTITVLIGVITITPGTVVTRLGNQRRTLLVHLLDTDDADAELELIRTRYMDPLKEIFG